MRMVDASARTGGKVVVDQLLIHGVDLAFCVPGESYLGVLDALYDVPDRIRLITTRNEIGAVHMAEAYGKLTGRPGICFVTRGPGASHAMVGVHTAFQDSTPLILFVGLVERGTKDREGLQEIDLRAMFGHTAKRVLEITDPRRIPELVSHAFHTAVAGRPGPVVLGLPEDVCVERCVTDDVERYQTVRSGPQPVDMAALEEILAEAWRPVVLLGGGGWTSAAVQHIQDFAENCDLPVTAAFRCQDLFDNSHKNYVGDCSLGASPALSRRIHMADLLLVIGARLGEATTQRYTLVTPPVPKQALVHVYPDPEELGRVYQGKLLINSSMPAFALAARGVRAPGMARWSQWREEAKRDYEASLIPDPTPGRVNLALVMAMLRETADVSALYACDGGNFASWLNRYIQFSTFRSLVAPACGAMGYGIPAAIAAKLYRPQREVICFVGDGGFLMSGQEFATAVQYAANIIVLVFNNGMYGTIRMYQERNYPGRHPATSLVNPDFAAFARAFGGHGETVETTDEFPIAFERARQSGRPSIIELRVDPEAITTRTTLSALRAEALGRKEKEGSR